MPQAGSDLAVYPLEPPTGGINGIQSLFNQPDSDCVDLINWVPKGGGGLRTRTGAKEEDDCSAIDANWEARASVIGTVGVKSFVFVLDGTTEPLEFIEFYSGTPTSRKGSATVPETPEWVIFKGKAFFAGLNGDHAEWSGSGNLTNTAWSFPAAPNNYSTIGSYKGRLYFGSNAQIVYGTTQTLGAVTGTVTTFDIEEFSQLGGAIAALGDLPVGSDQDREVLFYLYTDKGELFLYSGDSPFADNWQLVGRYELPPPTGVVDKRHCTVRVNGDIWLITTAGVVSMRSVLTGSPVFITEKIADVWRDLVKTVRTTFSVQDGLAVPGGIRAVYNTERDYVLFYHPFIKQIGYHIPTGSWFKFDLNARAFYFDRETNRMWFSQIDESSIYILDSADSTLWGEDPGGNLTCTFRQAYSSLGDRRTKKSIVQIEPYIAAEIPSGGALTVELTYQADPDYRSTTAITSRTESLTQSTINYLNPTVDVVEEGKVFSLKVTTNVEAPAEIEWQGCNVYYRQGGV